MTYPGRSSCLSGRTGLLLLVTAQEGHGGVSRGHSSQWERLPIGRQVGEGPNRLLQGADGRTRWAWSDSKARRTN
jgi:hypothetical protein